MPQRDAVPGRDRRHDAVLTQTKILRVLQEQQFERVGGGETIRTDVRVIAATNRDLEQIDRRRPVPERSLLSPERLHDPAAATPRARRGPAAVGPASSSGDSAASWGRRSYGVTPEAMDELRRYPWPGNVRELQSVLKQALVQTKGPILAPEFLPPAFLTKVNGTTGLIATPLLDLPDLEQFVNDRLMAGSTDLHTEWQAITEKFLLTHVLHHTGGNLSRTAQILGIHRSTVRNKIAALGIAGDRLTPPTKRGPDRCVGGGAERPAPHARDQPPAFPGEEQ